MSGPWLGSPDMRDSIRQTPRHGDRGHGNSSPRVTGGPIVAISPEPGSRGLSLAKAISRRLQWPLYDADALGYLIGQPGRADELMDRLDLDQRTWVEDALAAWRADGREHDAATLSLAQLVVAISCSGRAVFLGRGAGFLVPRNSVLHVGVVSPREERLAEMEQTRRLTPAMAEQQLAAEESRREEFLHGISGRRFAEADAFDLILNSWSLGEEACLQLIRSALASRFPAHAFAA